MVRRVKKNGGEGKVRNSRLLSRQFRVSTLFSESLYLIKIELVKTREILGIDFIQRGHTPLKVRHRASRFSANRALQN